MSFDALARIELDRGAEKGSWKLNKNNISKYLALCLSENIQKYIITDWFSVGIPVGPPVGAQAQTPVREIECSATCRE